MKKLMIIAIAVSALFSSNFTNLQQLKKDLISIKSSLDKEASLTKNNDGDLSKKTQEIRNKTILLSAFTKLNKTKIVSSRKFLLKDISTSIAILQEIKKNIDLKMVIPIFANDNNTFKIKNISYVFVKKPTFLDVVKKLERNYKAKSTINEILSSLYILKSAKKDYLFGVERQINNLTRAIFDLNQKKVRAISQPTNYSRNSAPLNGGNILVRTGLTVGENGLKILAVKANSIVVGYL